jgi:hypothetical protein
MPLSEAQTYLDHLSSCSPCYRDFLAVQAGYRHRRTRLIFALAASLLIVIGVATWAMLRQNNEHLARAVVDLRDRSMARGTEPPPNEAPLEIPRKASQLEIYLPLGSAEGTYELRIITARGDPLISVGGNAQLEQGVTVLRLALKTALPASGRYVLEIRRRAAEWASFPLEIH